MHVQGRHLVQQRHEARQVLDGEVQEAEADTADIWRIYLIFGYCSAPRAQGCCEGGAITGMDLQLEVQQTN